MEDFLDKSSYIQEIYDTNGKYKKEWHKFLFNIKREDSQINKEIKTKLEQSLNEKNNINLTCDIIDFIINYGSESIIDLILEKNFLYKFFGLMKKTANSPLEIQKKVLFLLQKWKIKYENNPKYSIVEKNYQYLKEINIRFPDSNYKIETYDKYISEEEIKQICNEIDEILVKQKKYRESIKKFMINARTTIMNPFLEEKEFINKPSNLPAPPESIISIDKSYRTPEDNIDNNIEYGQKDLKNIDNNTSINVKESLNKISKHIIEKKCQKDKIFNNSTINNNKSISNYNEDEKMNIIDDKESNVNIENYSNKESVKIPYNNIIIEKKTEDLSSNNTNKFNIPINNSINISTPNSIHNSNNGNLKNNNINNSQNNNMNNINNKNSSQNQVKENKDSSLNNSRNKNNINNNCEQNSNNNSFNVNNYKWVVGNRLLKINKEIDNRRSNMPSNFNLHEEIKGIINEISICESRINEYLSNSQIIENLQNLKMDIIQTCARYQCLIYKNYVPDFLSSFQGNNNRYNFNKSAIINFQPNNNLNNNNNFNNSFSIYNNNNCNNFNSCNTDRNFNNSFNLNNNSGLNCYNNNYMI